MTRVSKKIKNQTENGYTTVHSYKCTLIRDPNRADQARQDLIDALAKARRICEVLQSQTKCKVAVNKTASSVLKCVDLAHHSIVEAELKVNSQIDILFQRQVRKDEERSQKVPIKSYLEVITELQEKVKK
ncbi:uncharacterized protein PHALS_08645 [Plasmopara halstedii]|uniref:Uncharacterized protein n=1 Tax=Plasmopara halstedii TaxID=4781 RepID=A0A0P1ADD3_PLAHL|nr:uncharacterized protein PHALS_08645 [Plasmopara halstedii]CEG38581.1 hypothetical protein PHALS_08645 [Plasmopara halstedii]|eukprot:XP_024574950.1 hypothetical protein PHALS_08645 [Plasmopara halstedii]